MTTQKWLLVANIFLFLGALALVAFTLLTPGVLAQTPTATPTAQAVTPNPNGTPAFGPGLGMPGGMMGRGSVWMQGGRGGMMGGRGLRLGGPENSLVAVTAKQLDMTIPALIAELQAGKTISQVASEHDVSLSTLIDAFLAQRQEKLKELVANGQLTQEQADDLLALMRTRATERADQAWLPQGPGRGAGYTDENGDGMCDHLDGQGLGGRFGGRRGGGFGGGMGRGF